MERRQRAIPSTNISGRSVTEAKREFTQDSGKFPYQDISKTAIDYLLQQGAIKSAPPVDPFIDP
jgi:hypothetical protein